MTPVEVHFDNPDGGFFVRHPVGSGTGNGRQQQQMVSGNDDDDDGVGGGVGGGGSGNGGAVLSVDRFTVLQDVPQTSIRATYGPFSTKQTVPSRYLIPDPSSAGMSGGGGNGTGSLSSGSSSSIATAAVDISSMDVSAHLVQKRVYRENPVVRTLFHVGYSVIRSQSAASGLTPLSSADKPSGLRSSSYGKLCAVTKATFEGADRPITAACKPDPKDGVCTARLVLPAKWWPPLNPPDAKPVKTPQRYVQISYALLESDHRCSQSDVQLQPFTYIGQAALEHAQRPYKELKTDAYLLTLIPSVPLYPKSFTYVPVFFDAGPKEQNIKGFILR